MTLVSPISLAAVLGCTVVMACASSASAQVLPEAAAAPPRGEAVFGIDVIFPCLTHVERGTPIADLPEIYRTDLIPAVGADAKIPLGRETASAVWMSKGLPNGRLKLAEIGPDKCVIQAVALPVDDTLRRASNASQTLDPKFIAVPAKSTYWPVVYQTERTANGRHIVIRLEGAEPGGFGHASRFALMTATITATPAP